MSTFVPIFTKHSRHWQENRYVYPVVSRRSRGLSVGVNLNPDTICNFDCIYCCVDRSAYRAGAPRPDGAVDLRTVEAELGHLLELALSGDLWRHPPFDTTPEPLRRLNDVAFSGDGEPTSFAGFEAACRVARGQLDRLGQRSVKLVVITNATLFHQPRVRQALNYLDTANGELWAKLDAGTAAYYDLVVRSKVPLERVLGNILEAGRRRELVIQSLFQCVHGEPPPGQEVRAYLDRLSELKSAGCRIKGVQIYTVARQTAELYSTPLAAGKVDEIVEGVRGLGLEAAGFYGPS